MPEEHTGTVNVCLDTKSAEALVKVESLTLWKVTPTMRRGQKSSHAVEASQLPNSRVPRRRLVKGRGKGRGKGKGRKLKVKDKKGSAGGVDEVLLDPPGSNDYRRSERGRKLLQEDLRLLRNLDAEVFPKNPLFDTTGHCRMRSEQAKNTTWDEILHNAPACVELMFFSGIKRLYTILHNAS